MSWELAELRAPLAGRDREMAVLKAAVDESRITGEARFVTLIGGAGVGKARLIRELLTELRAAQTFVPRVFAGTARDLGLSHGVFGRLLRDRFSITESMGLEEARQRVRTECAAVLEDRKVEDVAHFLGDMMDIDFLESPLTRAVADDPTEGRSVRRAILRSFIEADAQRGPLVLVFEEVQDADGDSLDLLAYLMENLTAPVLLLCTGRPELTSQAEGYGAAGGQRHQLLEVGPLSDEAIRSVARELLQPSEGGVPEELVEAAVRPAGGCPGLVEQMVRIFHDVGVLVEEDPLADDPIWRVNLTKLASARLPLTVQEAVAARIGALSMRDRRLLEFGAAMGGVFWLGGVLALWRLDQAAPEFWDGDARRDIDEIVAALNDLVRRDYLLDLPDSTFAGETEYVFKHNLEREKVAGLTSATASQRYHQVLADWLSQQGSVRHQEEYMAMLARHLEQAGSRIKAGETYLSAGDIARGGYGAKKAHEYYERGLELLDHADAERRIDAHHNHGDVLLVLGRTDEALTAFRAMLTLAYRFRLKAKGGAAHNRIGRLHRDTGDLALATQHLNTARELFAEVDDKRGVAACHDDIGRVLWLEGNYDEARRTMMVGLEMRRELGDRRSIALSLNNIGQVWADHGRETKAQEALEAALTIRREIDDPVGIMQTLSSLGRLSREQGDLDRAYSQFHEAKAVAEELGERNRVALVLTDLGDTLFRQGKTEEAIEQLHKAEDICDEMGDRLHLAEAKRSLAEAYLNQGQLRAARTAIKQAVDLFGQVRGKAHLAIALRTLADVTAAGAWGESHEGKAIDYYMRSIALSKEIGNELEEAKSYRAFSSYVVGSPHYKNNGDIQREAARLNQLADEIFQRHKIRRQAEPDESGNVPSVKAPS